MMKMDDYKNFDNFQRTEGCKMISPHHFHPTNGVRPSDSDNIFRPVGKVSCGVVDTGNDPIVTEWQTRRKR